MIYSEPADVMNQSSTTTSSDQPDSSLDTSRVSAAGASEQPPQSKKGYPCGAGAYFSQPVISPIMVLHLLGWNLSLIFLCYYDGV